VRFTDTEKYFVSEASVYRLLKAHDLIASPAFILMKAADEFKDKTLADRLRLSESHRLGLVLSFDHSRRLFTLHHRLEAVHDDEGRRCHRHAELGTEGLGARPGKGHPPAKASLRQRPKSGRRSDWRSKLLYPRTCARGVIVVNSNALRN
jgi:hypothetical protein